MLQNSQIFGLNKYPNNTDARDDANLLLANAEGLACAAHFTARQIVTNNANSLTATTSVNCHEISAFYVQHLHKPAKHTASSPLPDIFMLLANRLHSLLFTTRSAARFSCLDIKCGVDQKCVQKSNNNNNHKCIRQARQLRKCICQFMCIYKYECVCLHFAAKRTTATMTTLTTN